MTESWKDLVKQLMWEMTPQDNYHGTPYTFKRFDDSKFLTGEGNMAHGRGHYSADLYDIAKRYQPYNSRDILDVKFKNGKSVPLPEIFQLDAPEGANLGNLSGNRLDKRGILQVVKDPGFGSLGDAINGTNLNQQVRNIPYVQDIIDNPNNYKIIYEKDIGNTYRVNVPNENYMWKEFKPLSEQSEYIQKLFKNRNIDFSKMLSSGISLDHDLEGLKLRNIDKIFGPMYDQLEYRGGLNNVTKKLFNKYMNELPLEQQLKFIERSGNQKYFKEIVNGIKGIRAIGNIDGPINVTFSGDNIKMANTPWQRLVNRIPKQTLGKIANKIVTSPAFKSFIDVSPALGVGAEYLKPLDIIRSRGNNKKQKIQQMFNDAGYELEIQPDGTYLFKM